MLGEVKAIGRNDLCYCGSGYKYKKCCMNDKFSLWKKNADVILRNEPNGEQIKSIFFELLDYIDRNRWQGACHATASILFILLSEIGLKPNLCIGMVKIDKGFFEHSWIEINNNIYDVAIFLALEGYSFPPVIKNCNIDTTNNTELFYGWNKWEYGNDTFEHINYLLEVSIVEFMDNCPNFPNGLWDILIELGNKLNIPIEIETLKNKYEETLWTLKCETLMK